MTGGIFTAYWALKHACEVNPGGIKEPINLAVLARDDKGKLHARMLEQAELDEHVNLVSGAMLHLRGFREIMEGREGTAEPPKPPG